MKTEAIKHADVKGKELCYIVITNSKGTKHIINVGEKTWKGVKDLIEEENQPELPLKDESLPKVKAK